MNSQDTAYFSQMPPITLILSQLMPSPATWHSSLQILYVVDGSCSFTLRGISYHISERHIAIISPMEIYTITKGNGTLALLQIDTELIGKYCPNFQLPALKSMLLTPEERTAYEMVTSILEELIRTSLTTDDKLLPLHYMIHGFRLTAAITDYCAMENQRISDFSTELPVLKAIEFTNTHFLEDISIRDAAEIAQYSIPYFSKLFSRIAGISYMKYVTQLRMQEAEKLLAQGAGISEIAKQCGFSDYRAFTRAYRQKYGENPSSRKGYRLPGKTPVPATPETLSVENVNLLTRFMASLKVHEALPVRQDYRDLPEISLNPLKQPSREFLPSWNQTIGLGRASLLLEAQSQNHVRALQEALHYRQATIHGLLDDDMQIIRLNEHGQISYSFIIVRNVIHFLLSVNLAPIIELGHMPTALAKNRSAIIHDGKSCISLPEHLDQWGDLIEAFINFLFSIYGQKVVETWEFCLWGKPEAAFWDFDPPAPDDYFRFYLKTYQTVKKMSRQLCFTSPAFLAFPLRKNWLNTFLAACRKHNCLPDRLRFAFYQAYFPGTNFHPGNSEALRRPSDPDIMEKVLAQLDAFCKENRLPYEKPDLAEWNFSISQREYLSDTCFMASYLVKNILNCNSLVTGISYWAYNDHLGEIPLSADTFYGGPGLCTVNGIRKPSFFAFLLLSRLGSRLIAQGDGYAVTRNDHDIQILFYNYCHFSVLYANGENFNESFSNRYDAFPDQKHLHCSLTLTDLPALRYLCTTRILNRKHGSAFDQWTDMGMITILTQDELDYIKGISVPQMKVRIVFPENGILRLTRELLPFELCLIELHAI